MKAEEQARADIVEVGRRLWDRGYVASNDGNISVRLDAGRLLMTPKSVCKGFMTPDMLCITDLEGRIAALKLRERAGASAGGRGGPPRSADERTSERESPPGVAAVFQHAGDTPSRRT